MSSPWQILRAGGLPLVTEAAPGRPSAAELARAARAVIALAPVGRDAEALVAFLAAWRHHWPASYRAAFAADPGPGEVDAWVAAQAVDADRYLKLRRIAIAHLATIL
ncbi:MAG: hypothetical protein HS111_01135 [Kofleriaceae bacterium]|nr:hypothetical protein [Kofleriaceae bacterium]MCL4226706.1 hypothetical protein [Myxococcales bacterium]